MHGKQCDAACALAHLPGKTLSCTFYTSSAKPTYLTTSCSDVEIAEVDDGADMFADGAKHLPAPHEGDGGQLDGLAPERAAGATGAEDQADSSLIENTVRLAKRAARRMSAATVMLG